MNLAATKQRTRDTSGALGIRGGSAALPRALPPSRRRCDGVIRAGPATIGASPTVLTWRTADVLIRQQDRRAALGGADMTHRADRGWARAGAMWVVTSQSPGFPAAPPSIPPTGRESVDAGAAESPRGERLPREPGGQDHAANAPGRSADPGAQPPRFPLGVNVTPAGEAGGCPALSVPARVTRARSQLPTKVTASTRQRQHHSGRRRRKMDVYAHTRAR